MICDFPNCHLNAVGGKYCIGHAKIMSVPKQTKQPIPLAKRSKKMKKEFTGYRKQVALFLSNPKNKYCKIQAAGCTRIATCVHHVAGRTGKQLKNEMEWKPSCSSCNGHVEDHHAEARKNGHKKSRLTKVLK